MPTVYRFIPCLAVALLVGCQAKPKAGSVNPATPSMSPVNDTAVVSNTDPSATKLHDIEGALLMYYAVNKKLPERIEDIVPLADTDGPLDFTVPGTTQQYIYAAEGIMLQDRESRIVLYEPAPLHNGFRLAITVSEPKQNQPLVAKVIALPESFFLLRPPGSEKKAD